jgi:hypothetical protein
MASGLHSPAALQVNHATGPTANGRSLVVVDSSSSHANRIEQDTGRPAGRRRIPHRIAGPDENIGPQSSGLRNWWWQIDNSARSPSETIGDRCREGRSNKQLLIISPQQTKRNAHVAVARRVKWMEVERLVTLMVTAPSNKENLTSKTFFWQMKWLMLKEMTLVLWLLEVCLLKQVVMLVTTHNILTARMFTYH